MLEWIGRRKEASRKDLSSQLHLSVVLQNTSVYPGDVLKGVGFVFLDDAFIQYLGSPLPPGSTAAVASSKKKSSTHHTVTALTLKVLGHQSSGMGLITRDTIYYQQEVLLYQNPNIGGEGGGAVEAAQHHVDVSAEAMMEKKMEDMRRMVRGEDDGSRVVLMEKGSYLFPFEVPLPALLPWTTTVPTPPLSNVRSAIQYSVVLTLSLANDKQFSSSKLFLEVLPLPIPLWRWVEPDAKSSCLPPLEERCLIQHTMLAAPEPAESGEGSGPANDGKHRRRHRHSSSKAPEDADHEGGRGKSGSRHRHRSHHRHRSSGQSSRLSSQHSFVLSPPTPMSVGVMSGDPTSAPSPNTTQPYANEYKLSIRTSLMQKVKLMIPIRLSSVILTQGGGPLSVELTLDGSKDANMAVLHKVTAKLIMDLDLQVYQKYVVTTTFPQETSEIFDAKAIASGPHTTILKVPIPADFPLSMTTSDMRLETRLVLRFFVDTLIRKFNASIVIPVTVVRDVDRTSLKSRRLSYWTNNYDGLHMTSKQAEQHQMLFPVLIQDRRRLVRKSAELLDVMMSSHLSPPTASSLLPSSGDHPEQQSDELGLTYDKLTASTSCSPREVVFVPSEDPSAQTGSFELNPFQHLGSPPSI